MKFDKKCQRQVSSFIKHIIPSSKSKKDLTMRVVLRFTHIPKDTLVQFIDKIFQRRELLGDPITFKFSRNAMKTTEFFARYGGSSHRLGDILNADDS